MSEVTCYPGNTAKRFPLYDPLLRADVEAIFQHALAAVLPEAALHRHVHLDAGANCLTVAGRPYDLTAYRRIFVVGGGKAARRTGAALAALLGDRLTAGILNVYQDQASTPIHPQITLFAADHPTPNEAGAKGARWMLNLLEKADAGTLVIALISGAVPRSWPYPYLNPGRLLYRQ